MRLNSFLLAAVAAASFAMTGCAADADEPTDQTDTTDTAGQANIMDDRAHTALRNDQVELGARGGIAIADQFERRMYDFEATPRIGQREQFEVSLVQFNNASIIPRSGRIEGRDISLGTESGLSTQTGK